MALPMAASEMGRLLVFRHNKYLTVAGTFTSVRIVRNRHVATVCALRLKFRRLLASILCVLLGLLGAANITIRTARSVACCPLVLHQFISTGGVFISCRMRRPSELSK